MDDFFEFYFSRYAVGAVAVIGAILGLAASPGSWWVMPFCALGCFYLPVLFYVIVAGAHQSIDDNSNSWW